MFYSQFILAKKGPLGTIWIAAHLERKLRKNQVADTDIGESVDSILFPDVPIALRLSSHLLVGVVRIYSRKVNYLFHDCSEALLKIKQAFRSTAVDLPPEESTAPYHSITLPETFDLDDFELPDSALLSGNFVDHHVSAREQITLQDTVNATGYSTSQFGLDERFGDGDASQIRLDLDEDVVLDKGSAAHDISNLLGSGDVEYQIPGQPETPFPDMDLDGCQNDYEDEQNAETAKNIPEHFSDNLGGPVSQNVQDLREEHPSSQDYNVQTPYLHKGVSHGEHVRSPSAVPENHVVACPVNQILPDSTENAQAPSTPGLMQEAIPANVQENPALSPSGKASPTNDMEAIVLNAPQSSHVESECHDPNENDAAPLSVNADLLKEREVVSPAPQPLDHSLNPPDRSIPTCGNSLETNGNLVKDTSESHNLGSQDPAGAAEAFQDNSTLTSNSGSSLRSCNIKMNQGNFTSPQDGTDDLLPKEPFLSASDFTEGKEQLNVGGSSVEVQDTDINCNSGCVRSQDEADFSKDDVSPKVIPNDARLEINCSASSEYPEPERMLFATGGHTDVRNDLGQCTIDFGQYTTAEKGVTESDGSVDRVKSNRGRKRHLTESTPVLLHGDSAKLSRASQLGRSTDYIPDDDDVLASILVGRTPGLKMKPTPTLPTVPSSKRPRLSARVGVPKRKVLMDDTMVLHADAIRQQLINTEDIRRTRRKAPCTHSEIWMIQKCSLEEEIFSEPVLSGLSMELVILHRQAYHPNEIPDSQFDKNYPHAKVSNVQNPGSTEFVEEARVHEIGNVNATITEKSDGERQEFTDVHQSPQTMPGCLGCDADRQTGSLQDAFQPKLSSGDHQCPGISTEPYTGDVVNNGAQEPLLSVRHLGGECHIPADAVTETSSLDKQKGAGEMNSELPLQEDHQSLLESSQFCEEFGEMNAKLEVKVSEDDMLIFTEEACTAGDGSLSCPQGSDLDACKAVTDDVPISMVDNCSNEVEAAFSNDPSVLEADASTSVQDTKILACEPINMANSTCIQSTEQIREQNVDSVVDGEVVADRMNADNGKLTSEHVLVNVPQVAVSDTQPTSTGVEDNPSAVGENSSIHDVMDMEGIHIDSGAPRDSNVQDFCSAIGGNDTDFLNVDDEADFDEEVDNEVPNTEEAQSIENSGWSTRTRGVARYLRSLFDDGSGLRKTYVPMDHLLAGKTRKEASRMFFETLVLKTKDYIHVEQDNSFTNINIKPRSKLLKSEF